MTTWVDALLCRWGRWAVRKDSSALGYGSVSPMFRDYRSGGGWSKSADPGFTPRDVIECDQAVSALPVVLRVVVICHYQRASSLRKTAEECGISHRTASQYINQAQEMIREALCVQNSA